MKDSWGENNCNPSKKAAETRIVTIVTIVNVELINACLLTDLGRYLFKLELNPRVVKLHNNVIIEIRVVAIPTFSALNSRAIMIQKTNPNAPSMNVLAILNMEFI